MTTKITAARDGRKTIDPSLSDRFIRLFRQARVVKEPNGCWRWDMALDSSGYGIISTRWGSRKNCTARAHRIAYLAHNGNLPTDGVICHQCDNRHCVNPEHLFWGTYQDNMRDAAAKGKCRSSRNRINRMSISDLLAKGLSVPKIAKRLNLDLRGVYRIAANLRELEEVWPEAK